MQNCAASDIEGVLKMRRVLAGISVTAILNMSFASALAATAQDQSLKPSEDERNTIDRIAKGVAKNVTNEITVKQK